MSYDNSSFNEQDLYLSGLYVYGIQSVTTEFNYPASHPLAMGMDTPIGRAEEGVINGEVFVGRLLTTKSDPVTGFFPHGVSGHLSYENGHAYIFETGLIKNYSYEVEVGELPSLDFTLSTWGTITTSSQGSSVQPGSETKEEEQVFLPTPGDIVIDIEDCAGGSTLSASSNAIRHFSMSAEIDWQSVTTLGALRPAGFYPKLPLHMNCTVQFEVNDFASPDFEKSLCRPILKNITVKTYNCNESCAEDSELIRSMRIPAAQLIGYNQFSDIDGVLIGEALFESTNGTLESMGKDLSAK